MKVPPILYINLDYRTDRREQIEAELKHFTFERVCAIRTDPGIIGCGQSHLLCLEIAKTRGLPMVWIMEDDFTFTQPIPEVLKTLDQINEIPDVIFAAYIYMGAKPDDEMQKEGLRTATDIQTASSYIVFEHYYDTLINNIKEGNRLLVETGEHWNYSNDQYWKRLQICDNWAYIVPRFGIQRASYSDNANEVTDYGF